MSWERNKAVEKVWGFRHLGKTIYRRECPRCDRFVWFEELHNDGCLYCDIEATMIGRLEICDILEEKRMGLESSDDPFDYGYYRAISDVIELVTQKLAVEKSDHWPCEFGGGW